MELLLLNKQTYNIINSVLIVLIIISSLILFVVLPRNGDSFQASDYTLVEGGMPFHGRINLRPLAEYKKIVSSRELFRPYVLSKKKGVSIKTINDVAKDLILVGVVSVDNKEAIIKNRRNRQTYFVTEGSRVGELKVEKISDDKIEVSYKQERKELFLR